MLPEGLNTGTVKWFDAREGKRFGFIIVDDYEGFYDRELFFHYNDGQSIEAKASVAEGKHPQFTGRGTRVVNGQTQYLRVPKQGERIIFGRSQGYHGDKASPWGYYDRWETAQKWLDEHQEEVARFLEDRKQALANRPYYRIQESMGAWGKTATPEKPEGASILWEGQDIDEVRKNYPVPSGRQSPGADPLLPFYSHDDGYEIHRWWEVKKPDGTWEHCPDQRQLSGVLRTFERITHRW